MKKNIIQKLSTQQENTWCPGCTNNGILTAVKQSLAKLIEEKKVRQKNIVTVCDIGCGAKIYDYLNLNGFYSIHGRILPAALGIKMGNPFLKVLAFGGDGGTYSEGISHFIHNCRYNADFTLLVSNNQVFALTTGQSTPTSEKGFKGPVALSGTKEKPLNPITLALESGATFVARGYALDIAHLAKIIKKAMEHRGFSFIDILQPCITFHNVIPYFQKNIYKLGEKKQKDNLEEALKTAKEWDYCFDKKMKVPIGVFYQKENKTYAENHNLSGKPFYKIKKKVDFNKVISEFKR